MRVQSKIYKLTSYSIYRQLSYFMVGILFFEFCTMIAMDFLPPLPSLMKALIDCIVLLILLTPVVYFLVIRPESRYQIERKRANIALKESETHFYTLANSGQALIWTSDVDKKCNYFNQPWLDFTGRTLEQELGDGWAEGVHPDDLQQCVETYVTAFDRQEKFIIEYRLHHSSGEYFWIQNNGSPRYNSKNEFIGYIGHCLDITERKQAETYSEVSREILEILNETGDIHDLIEQSLTVLKGKIGFEAVGIRIQDGEDFPFFAQKGFSNEFLLTENTLIEQSNDGEVCRDIDNKICLACTCGLVISDKKIPGNPFFTQGGSWWTNNSSPILDIPPSEDVRFRPRNKCIQHGFASMALVPVRNMDKIVAVIQLNDLSKDRFTKSTVEKLEGIASYIGAALIRSHTEELLRKKEEKRLSILQTAMDGFWVVDSLGCIVEVNDTYCQMSGYNREELLSLLLSDLEAHENVDDIAAHTKIVIEQGKDRFETRHRRKDGSIFDVEVSTQYRPEERQFATFLRNITERKLVEENLRQSEERYKSLFQSNNSVMLLMDPNTGDIMDANPAAIHYYGWTHSEMCSKNIAEINTLSKEKIFAEMQNAKNERRNQFFMKHQLANGEVRDVEIFSGPIKFSKTTLLYSIIHDITERTRAERALLESEEKVRIKLQSILSPEGNISDLELNDIIDVPSIQKLMDNFYELVQIPMAIIDINGKILVGVGWQDICAKFHRVHPMACRNCFESDVHLTHGITDGEFKLYKCKNNMWDMATPLIIGGEHKGNLYLGQFFFKNEPIDQTIFSKQAHIYGFDEKEYLDALGKVPRLSKQQLDHAKAFFLNLSRSISQLSYGNIKLARAIAQQKIIEDALRESEESLEKAQEIAHLGSWTLDLNENLLTWSDEIYRIFGLEPKEFSATYEGFLEAVHPEDRDAVNSAYSNSIKDGKDSYEIEHRIIRRHSREVRHVYEKCEHIRDTSGRIIRSVGMIHDITERKQSENAILENERLLRESQAVGNIGSYSVDLINSNWKASSEVYKIFGIDKTYSNSLDGWVDSLHPEFRDELVNDLFNREPGKEKFEHEYKIKRINDRQERWVSGLGKFEYDGQINPVRLIGTIQDITEHKLKEEALLKLNQILTAIGKSSQAMSQASNEADYLNQVCKIVVDDTDFAMVWIGFAEEDKAKSIRPVAYAGFNDNYLETIKLSWGDNVYGRGPTGVAIRTGNMSVCNNMLTDPAFEPWREQALKNGYASSIVFPLKTSDKTFGAISIYSTKIDSFLVDEIKLLSELANDLEHGITLLRLRQAHQLAEEALSKSYSELEELVKKRTLELQIINDLLKKELAARTEQEEKLKLAEEKYRTVADHTHGWEFWLDKDDNFIYCSPSCERITGYKAAEFLKNPRLLFEIIHPDDLKSFQTHKKTEGLCQVGNHEFQYRIVRNDGSIRWIGHECQPIYDESNNFMGVRGSNRDITERKNMDQLLKTSNRKYRLLSENITDGIFICRDGSFEYTNKAMNHIFGYENNELIGLNINRLVLPEYSEELDFMKTEPPTSQKKNIELECSKKDQTVITVEFLFNYNSKEKVIYGVTHDITEKKQVQKNIVKAIILTEEKERAHFSKELHDGLGPLLSTIKLYLQWSERSKNDASRQEIIGKAEDVVEDAISSVKEISNKLSPHLLINYGLCSAIHSFINKLEEISAIQIEFNCNISRRLGNEIEAAVYRAIIECINNTIKHSEAKNINMYMRDSGDQLDVKYNDDGKGFNIEETLAIKKGLGLFNLQNRIQNIGGKISMYSEPGKGVDYQITIYL